MFHRRPKACDQVSFIVTVLVCCLSGCREGYQQETAGVKGVVTLDGKPITTGWVFFTPANGRASKGAIGTDGAFELGTYGTRDGAIVGRHTVTVVAREQGSTGAEGVPGKSMIPERYSSPTVSRLTFEVKAGESNTADLKLTSK